MTIAFPISRQGRPLHKGVFGAQYTARLYLCERFALPVEAPTKFELRINLKTAKQIGLAIPQSVLFKADKVIKEASAKAGGR